MFVGDVKTWTVGDTVMVGVECFHCGEILDVRPKGAAYDRPTVTHE